ncbi:MAG: hypothetical protein ACLU37_05450 [Collinsella sp.]
MPKKVAFELKTRYGAVNFPRAASYRCPTRRALARAAAWSRSRRQRRHRPRGGRAPGCCNSWVPATTTNGSTLQTPHLCRSGSILKGKACSDTSIKKDVAIIAVVLCLCLGVGGSSSIIQISSALFNIGSMYGRFIEAAGELPFELTASIAGVMLVRGASDSGGANGSPCSASSSALAGRLRRSSS